LFDFA